eukprot:CAMPEP_0176439140 /NCGR_PEP_ID=MMETSP0127-20121128/19755_1 /TAXON_ID=938130 /ORGANISM="Platyophrya macrostoma, Strain WH" /LENGTH=373 /DNA_ID=CAMNT_0017823331 /DNA_START=200 /DNA_END=1321 /DNA_ORIENTATION=-
MNVLNVRNTSIYDLDELSGAFEALLIEAEEGKRCRKTYWSAVETNFLISLIAHYCQFSSEDFLSLGDKDWQCLEALFPTKKSNEIIKRWNSLLKTDLKQNPWTHEEDKQLKALVEECGTEKKWKVIAEKLNSLTKEKMFRHPRQCRERWINYVNPRINRGDWTEEEDLKLMESFLSMGKKWADIAKTLGNRTENAVRNRFNGLIRKEILKGECLDENLAFKGDVYENKVVNRLIESFPSKKLKPTQPLRLTPAPITQSDSSLKQIPDKTLSNYQIHPKLPTVDPVVNPGLSLTYHRTFSYFNYTHSTTPQSIINNRFVPNFMPESHLSVQNNLFKLSWNNINYPNNTPLTRSPMFFALVDINSKKIQLLDKIS